jgi:hypothetical protein
MSNPGFLKESRFLESFTMRGIILVLLSLYAATSYADTPWYVGGGVGLTKLSQDNYPTLLDGSPANTMDFDDNGNSIQLFAGFEIDSRWAVEGGYIDFGDAKDSGVSNLPIPVTIPTNIKFEADGWYVNAQYHIPVGEVGSFDLLGGWILGDSKTKSSILGTSETHNDSGMMIGVAFTMKTTDTIYLRGTATYYNLDYDGVIDKPYRLGLDLIYDF